MAKTIIKVIKNVKITFPLVAFAISAMAKQNAKIKFVIVSVFIIINP